MSNQNTSYKPLQQCLAQSQSLYNSFQVLQLTTSPPPLTGFQTLWLSCYLNFAKDTPTLLPQGLHTYYFFYQECFIYRSLDINMTSSLIFRSFLKYHIALMVSQPLYIKLQWSPPTLYFLSHVLVLFYSTALISNLLF